MNDWQAQLAASLAEAEREVIAATNDVSLCSISRLNGQQAVNLTAAKTAEGAWAALRAVRDARDRSDLLDRIAGEMARAEEQALTTSGVAWQAYAHGALAALRQLRQRLDAPAP